MGFKVDVKKEAGKWFDYDGIEGVKIRLKIKPRSMYGINLTPGENYQPSTEDIWKMFDYSLIDWEGIDGEDDKPLPCTPEAKFAMINQNDEIGVFVMTKSNEMREGDVTEKQAKNLKKSPDGATPKSEKPLVATA